MEEEEVGGKKSRSFRATDEQRWGEETGSEGETGRMKMFFFLFMRLPRCLQRVSIPQLRLDTMR